jgi:hypothetical protein
MSIDTQRHLTRRDRETLGDSLQDRATDECHHAQKLTGITLDFHMREDRDLIPYAMVDGGGVEFVWYGDEDFASCFVDALLGRAETVREQLKQGGKR